MKRRSFFATLAALFLPFRSKGVTLQIQSTPIVGSARKLRARWDTAKYGHSV